MRLLISSFQKLLSHSRFMLTIRSQGGIYRGLILFRLSPNLEETLDAKAKLLAAHKQLYIMESACPHLGADMSHADIEEHEDGVVAVCPWHRYDFDLKTGANEMGLHACTYPVHVETDDADGIDKVYMEPPALDSEWTLVELRPVSEEFADPPPTCAKENIEATAPISMHPVEDEPIVPVDNAPNTLMEWAVLILNTPNPLLKVERTRHAVQMFRTGQLKSIGNKKLFNPPQPPDVPRRDALYVKNSVDPTRMRTKKSKAFMLHALANIEQWAIDLAWDIMARFGPMHPDLPPAFFSDFAKMALDESKHFSLLTARLAAISPSTPYGSMPVHASLWESASITSTSLRARLAIIHLVHEARGLDVNPQTIERFRKAGDSDSVNVMEIVHADEVTHVTTGHRWFTWMCEKDGGLDPITTFREEVRQSWRGDIKGPFNAEARKTAGLSPGFYENLRGEMDTYEMESSPAKVQIGYD
ncbi:DUF455-domain-containing protein [Cylindrobasidium torrendii FP15055 ss-10]|uniref:DUF455-domain-containing protein n=1 Tax=Cylindrobasidium torrendii FP15055 ss-10 TaxID=1314674 RepID=A0A0D7BMN4_9AGAR|nr:DUF455-domain-containing protein [Cylindrobasidium torrendii FP15055 ss-10]